MIEGIVISNGAGQNPNSFSNSVITPTPIKIPKSGSLVASIANQASMLTSHTLNGNYLTLLFSYLFFTLVPVADI